MSPLQHLLDFVSFLLNSASSTPSMLENSSLVRYAPALTTFPSIKVIGNTSTPLAFKSALTSSFSLNSFGSSDKLYLIILNPLFFKASKTVATRNKFGSILGPHTPVEQHIAGS